MEAIKRGRKPAPHQQQHHVILEGETLAAALLRVKIAADIRATGTEDVQLLAHILMENYNMTPKETHD